MTSGSVRHGSNKGCSPHMVWPLGSACCFHSAWRHGRPGPVWPGPLLPQRLGWPHSLTHTCPARGFRLSSRFVSCNFPALSPKFSRRACPWTPIAWRTRRLAQGRRSRSAFVEGLAVPGCGLAVGFRGRDSSPPSFMCLRLNFPPKCSVSPLMDGRHRAMSKPIPGQPPNPVGFTSLEGAGSRRDHLHRPSA